MEPITLYSTTWCPDCRRAKNFLKERGVAFEEVNIEEDPAGEEIVIRANHGKRRVPTLKVGERYFACSPFNAHLLAAELKIP
jgi:mycoredoxin